MFDVFDVFDVERVMIEFLCVARARGIDHRFASSGTHGGGGRVVFLVPGNLWMREYRA